jgi:hypothetical protein
MAKGYPNARRRQAYLDILNKEILKRIAGKPYSSELIIACYIYLGQKFNKPLTVREILKRNKIS